MDRAGEAMMQHTQNDSYNYTGDEEPDSERLIKKALNLSQEAQNVLYVLLTTEGEDNPASFENV
jgi:hypothetical protein